MNLKEQLVILNQMKDPTIIIYDDETNFFILNPTKYQLFKAMQRKRSYL